MLHACTNMKCLLNQLQATHLETDLAYSILLDSIEDVVSILSGVWKKNR